MTAQLHSGYRFNINLDSRHLLQTVSEQMYPVKLIYLRQWLELTDSCHHYYKLARIAPFNLFSCNLAQIKVSSLLK